MIYVGAGIVVLAAIIGVSLFLRRRHRLLCERSFPRRGSTYLLAGESEVYVQDVDIAGDRVHICLFYVTEEDEPELFQHLPQMDSDNSVILTFTEWFTLVRKFNCELAATPDPWTQGA